MLYRPFVMLASEPILLLVTTCLSAVYGVLYVRTYPHLAYQPIVLTVRVTDLLLNHSSLRSIPHHLHRTPQPLHLPNRPHLPQPRNRCLPRRPPQPLFTVQMYHKVRSATLPALLHHSPVLNRTVCFVLLGINWASTLIAGIALVLAPIPFLFFKYGARIRQGSRFAPCTV